MAIDISVECQYAVLEIMSNWVSKFLSMAGLVSGLAIGGCHRQPVEVSALPAGLVSHPPIAPEVKTTPKPASKPTSITELIYEQAGKDLEDLPGPKISKVPLLSVKFANYLVKQNGKISICSGETLEAHMGKFPKIYPIGDQEYLVELHCKTSTYNIRFGYVIYRPESPLAAIEMRKFPEAAYARNDQGDYFLSRHGLNQATIPKGDVIPQEFDQYWLDETGQQVQRVDDSVVGKRLYDPNQRIIWVLTKGRGMGDCGQFARYHLEADSFKLLEYRYQACCSTEAECKAPGDRRPPHEYALVYP